MLIGGLNKGVEQTADSALACMTRVIGRAEVKVYGETPNTDWTACATVVSGTIVGRS